MIALPQLAMPHLAMPLHASVRQYANPAFIEHRIAFQPHDEVEHIATIHTVIKASLDLAALNK